MRPHPRPNGEEDAGAARVSRLVDLLTGGLRRRFWERQAAKAMGTAGGRR